MVFDGLNPDRSLLTSGKVGRGQEVSEGVARTGGGEEGESVWVRLTRWGREGLQAVVEEQGRSRAHVALAQGRRDQAMAERRTSA